MRNLASLGKATVPHMFTYYHTILVSIVVIFVTFYFASLVMNRILMSANYEIYTGGSKLFYVLLAPGVIVHETSHALACLLLRVKIYEFKPLALKRIGSVVYYGWVKRENTNNPIKEALISTAPIYLGLIILLALTLIPFWNPIGYVIWNEIKNLISMKENTPVLEPLTSGLNMLTLIPMIWLSKRIINPLFWIIPYISLTIILSAAPSSEDLAHAIKGLKYLTVAYLAYVALTYFLPILRYATYGFFETLFVLLIVSLSLVAMGFLFLIALYMTFRIGNITAFTPYLMIIILDLILYPLINGAATIMNIILFYITLYLIYKWNLSKQN